MMNYLKVKNVIALVMLLVVVGLAQASTPAPASAPDRSPGLPTGCESLEIEEGNGLAFRTYAMGVQVYRWNGLAWVFVEPRATLFADARYRGEVGTHYVGPT